MDSIAPSAAFVNLDLDAFPALTDLESADDLGWPSEEDLAAMAEESAALDVVCSGHPWL